MTRERQLEQALMVIKHYSQDPWAEHIADTALNGRDLDKAVMDYDKIRQDVQNKVTGARSYLGRNDES